VEEHFFSSLFSFRPLFSSFSSSLFLLLQLAASVANPRDLQDLQDVTVAIFDLFEFLPSDDLTGALSQACRVERNGNTWYLVASDRSVRSDARSP